MNSTPIYLTFITLFSPFIFWAQGVGNSNTANLYEMSLEDLLNMEVTSVSKKAERLQDVPNSIYVVTQEDIERSSAQNLMQLLRDNIPGFWATSNTYKNSDLFIRNTSEGSVLILLDGTPLLDLVSFRLSEESFDIPFDQINRIEVIKGSGGSVYGANSASGVINIITQQAADQKEIIAQAEFAYPGQTKVSLIASPIRGDKFNASIYGKATTFSGFEQLDVIKNESSTVQKTYEDGDTTINSRFLGDDQSYTSISGGYSLTFKASEDLTFSSATNIASTINKQYSQYFPRQKGRFIERNGQPAPFTADTAILLNNNKNRITGNLRIDYRFSEKHSLFGRVSTNQDISKYNFAGGYNTHNNIVDFEIQDNIEISFNNFSIGGNYRMVNYDIEVNELSNVIFTNPDSKESITGLFIQDKLSLLDKKLNLYLGVKAENFSLVDNQFYLSPMAKFAFIPSDNFTFWGGYTQSYTTPGFVQSKIEMDIFRSTTDQLYPFIYAGAYPEVNNVVYQQVYDNTYQQYIANGADEATATASASEVAKNYVHEETSKQAQAYLDSLYPTGNINISAINGKSTKPTSFQNFEAGIKMSFNEKLHFETNYYYTIMKDGVGSSLEPENTASPTREGEHVDALYYGNYLKGNNQGIESVIKFKAKENLMLEFSHSWYSYKLEYQENDDFSTEAIEYTDEYSETPILPEHVVRAKAYYDPIESLKISISASYASEHFVRQARIISTYQYEKQRFDPLYGDGGNQELIGGKKDNRLILNIRADKMFLQNKVDFYVYAYDLLNLQPFVSGINQLETAYPQQIGGYLGAGLKYMID